MAGPSLISNRFLPRAQITSSGPIPGGDSLLAVANIAALQALDDTAVDDGGAVSMKSLLDLWILDKTSPLPVDGITVVLPNSGAGRWIRLQLPNLTWQLQTTWYINETTGNDENSGVSSLAPLKTWEEYQRRIGEGPLTVSHTVNLVGTINQDIEVRAIMDDDTKDISILGIRSAPLYSGTFSAVTNENAGANQELQLTDAAIPVSWTASGLVDKLCVLTSGPNAGAAGWIVNKDFGTTARATKFYSAGTGYVEPAVGETFDVVDLGLVNGSLSGIDGGNTRCRVQDLRVVNTAKSVFEAHGGYWNLLYCDIEGGVMNLAARSQRSSFGEGTGIQASRLRASSFILINRGTVTISAVYAASGFHMRSEGAIICNQSCIVQYTGVGGFGFNIRGASRLSMSEPIGVFDYPSPNNRALRLLDNSAADIGDFIYGYGNIFDYAILVGPGCTAVYDVGFKPLVTAGALSDTLIGGMARNYASLPAANLTKLAGIVQS